MRTVLIASLCSALLSACIPLPGGAMYARKQVAVKQAPSTLISSDSMRCDVSAEVFGSTQILDEVACVWRELPRGPV